MIALIPSLFALTTALGAGGPVPPRSAVEAAFGPRGLTEIRDRRSGAAWRLRTDGFRLVIDGKAYDSADLPAPARSAAGGRTTYRWKAGAYVIEVVYETRPDWAFVSKQLTVTGSGAWRVDSVTPLRLGFEVAPADVHTIPATNGELDTGAWGAAIRGDRGPGLLALVQDPFLSIGRAGGLVTVSYAPAMPWNAADGAFPADRALLVPYQATGRRLPAAMAPEWAWHPAVTADGLDEAEVLAFTDAVRAFLIAPPAHPTDVFVGWTANDYQIDVGTAAGQAEYRRVLDRAAELGARDVLYAPANSTLSTRDESVDDWHWEYVLWFGLGPRIRRGEWRPDRDTLPASIKGMIDYARSRGLKLLAYVYPVMPFAADSSWIVSPPDAPDRHYANLASRALQDWLITQLTAFYRRNGIGGYSFDHTFLDLPGAGTYAQWWGWRRVMEELKRRNPGIVIDGRQAYQLYGPWSWLAGTYPHPTGTDEQPESFVPFPDLHIDRVSADRERYTAYRYRNYEFAPSELVPGFMTHQTPRADATGRMPERRTARGGELTSFRTRDWDYLGWRYSVLSSIAVAGWNNVINDIPARDLAEDTLFRAEDGAWLRGWLTWADAHRELLRRTRTILGPPGFGKVDGTSAVDGDSGYIFLFNPNAIPERASLPLGGAIGLPARGRWIVTEREPLSGRRLASPDRGIWSAQDTMTVTVPPVTALVLQVAPAPARIDAPILFGVPGSARLAGDTLALDGMRGDAGTDADATILLPAGARVTTVRVDGAVAADARIAGGMVTVPVRFAGAAFGADARVGAYDPTFTGGPWQATFAVPARVFDQLARRARQWPVPWTAEDHATPWLVPERLLLYAQFAEPDDRWELRMWIDGRPVEVKKAYSSVRPVPHDFVGFYADVSLLTADRPHHIELEVPQMRAGQFQGLFFENVEPEYTTAAPR
ncbi:MAG TPA: hypothetical protein VFU45_03825 [Gemmatimonadales bacterium]|nr:hypothetical protein [Gemmatimonadales bacterium]